jgi:cell division septation protein DedD
VPEPINPTAAGRARRPVLETPPPARPRPRRSRLLLIGLPIVAVFAAFGSIVWLAYDRGVEGPPVGEPPLARAPTVALKLAPEDDGASIGEDGEVVDMLSDAPSEQLERLLPPPEQPLAPPEQAPTPTEQAATEEAGDPASATAELAPPETTPVERPAPEVAATTPAPAGTPPEDQQAAVEAAPTPPAAETPALSDEQQTALLGAPEPPLGAPEPPASEPAPSREEAEATLDALLAEVTELNERQPPEPEPAPATTARVEPVAPRPAPVDEVRPAVAPPAAQPAPAALPPLTPPGAQVTPIERDRRPPTNGPPGVPPPVVEPAPERSNLAALDGDYRIQLAAVREEADARRAWDLFLVDLGPVLGGLQPFIERAETANGVFYRVQIGPFASLQEAESLCDQLKQRNASCFVIRR